MSHILLVECNVLDNKSSSLSLQRCYCMSLLKDIIYQQNSTYVVGHCIFTCSRYHLDRNNPLYRKLRLTPDGDDEICESYNRQGPMCGHCLPNYAPLAYDYNFTCVECDSFSLNWLKYITIAYLPLTGFYVLVLVFKVSATTGTLNALVTICQLASAPGVVRNYFIPHHPRALITIIKLATVVCSIWNLDFFRSLYKPFCLHPSITTITSFTLEYALGLYPLLLVIITYILVKLHDRYAVVVFLWRPFNKCLSRFTRTLNIKESLVQAFATFILLSYVKILNVSFDILTPGQRYLTLDDKEVDTQFWYYNGTLEFFGKDHLPYAVLAILMSLLFNILPLALLAMYPFMWFRRLLQILKLESNTLNIFMETFCGCYRSEPNCRQFAVVYILLRVANLLLYSTIRGPLYYSYASYLFTAALVVVATVRPYRVRWHNTADTVLFLAILSFYQFSSMIYQSNYLDPNFIYRWPRHLPLVIFAVVISIPGSYWCLIVAWKSIPGHYKARVKTKATNWFQCLFKNSRNMEELTEDSLPHRMQQSDEHLSLLA